MTTTRGHRIPQFVLATLTAGGLLAGLATPATAASVNCIVRDGVATTGTNIGGKPTRWEYGNSPSIGVRYDSCADVFKIYIGGYSGITHHNILLSYPSIGASSQIEVGPNPGRYTITASEYQVQPGYPLTLAFAVQACKRGGVLQPSSCTRWSPSVLLDASR